MLISFTEVAAPFAAANRHRRSEEAQSIQVSTHAVESRATRPDSPDTDGAAPPASADFRYDRVDLALLQDLFEPFLGRDSADATARSLLARFGSAGAVLAAPKDRVICLEGCPPRVSELLAAVRRLMVSTLRRRLENKHLLSSHSRVVSYLKTLLAHESSEHLRVLYLDVRCRLIVDDLANIGTLNHAPAYPREIVRRALDVGAKSIILVHNHPSGNPTPSPGDISTTRLIAANAAVFEIDLLDHYVVGRNEVLSMKQLGLLPFGRLQIDYEPRGMGKAVVRDLPV